MHQVVTTTLSEGGRHQGDLGWYTFAAYGLVKKDVTRNSETPVRVARGLQRLHRQLALRTWNPELRFKEDSCRFDLTQSLVKRFCRLPQGMTCETTQGLWMVRVHH